MAVFSELDQRAITMARALAADAVQNVGNGHPGTAMALAPAAYLLFQKHLRHNPANPHWEGRDRFILSIGHSSLTLYTQLFLCGYGLEIEDFKQFRKAGSLTPGHPEFGHTAGVETTTGPLGQGVANAVGLAIAAQYRKAQANSEAYGSLLDQQVFCLLGDGCMQEGVAAEAASLAGHLKLPNLVLIYDDNSISIDGSTDLSFTEDVSGRFRAYGWHVLEVPKQSDGDIDADALDAALTEARDYTEGPVLIRMESTIAWPAPNLRGTAKSHGSALGAAEVAATKELLGLDPNVSFFVDDEALAHARKVSERGAQLEDEWDTSIDNWSAAEGDSWQAWYETFLEPANLVPANLFLPTWEVGTKVATRKASGIVLNSLAPKWPILLGGSADLSESNGTLLENTQPLSAEHPEGRNIHFGIREHAMGGILNGLALAGLRPYGGTFLVFSDYMRGAVRLAALMNLPVTQVWTHDSIGLGEDGPTHQPIEQLASLRLIPNFSVVRPADANETAAAWGHLLTHPQPACLALSRQDLPVISSPEKASFGVERGGYEVTDCTNPQVIIIATGSEVAPAVAAVPILAGHGVRVRVVSMPCTAWFDAQPEAYRQAVLRSPIGRVPVLAVEAGATAGWYKYADKVIGIDHFGASAAPDLLFAQYGFTAENIAAIAMQMVS